MKTRIIAKLDVKPPYVVKPVHFEGLRKIGSPVDLAKKYYDQGADEIVYVDIVSSLYQREILYENIKNTAKEVFVPFGVGGGIKSIDDCAKLFEIGADKVIINTHALQANASVIDDVAKKFGSQSIVVNIEAKKFNNNWECLSDCGRIRSYKMVLDWAKEVQNRGAGEIFLQSVDCDGRQKGYDLELAHNVVNAVSIPVVVGSGAGCVEDIKKLILFAKPSGVSISSLIHYDKANIGEIKKYLKDFGIKVSK